MEQYDVIVIGGGPGGSTAASFLAMAKRKVLLLEASSFPRYHIGESLLPGTNEFLEKLGVMEKMEAYGFIRKYGVEWIWGKTRIPWSISFKDAVANPYNYGYQVERADFDYMLLNNAREKGVIVKEKHRVLDVIKTGDRVTGVICQSLESKECFEVHARWLIDASGQNSLLSKKFHKKKWDKHLSNMAVWSYWKNAKRNDGIYAGNSFIPVFSDGWCWFLPQRHNITSVGCVLDCKSYEEVKEAGLEKLYLDAIDKTPELKAKLADATRIANVKVMRDWSYINDRFYGDGYCIVGDAAAFIDPLFSTGVHFAMLSAYLAAAVVNTILTLDMDEVNGVDAAGQAFSDSALEFYQRRFQEEYDRVKEQVYFLYSSNAAAKEDYFWKARSLFELNGDTSGAAFTSLIAGTFQHRFWYYSFLSKLETPKWLESKLFALFSRGGVTNKSLPYNDKVRLGDGFKMGSSFLIENLTLKPIKTIVFDDQKELADSAILQFIIQCLDGEKDIRLAELHSRLKEHNSYSDKAIKDAFNISINYGVLQFVNTRVTGVAA